MKRRGLSQEGLKLIACVAMTMDHGAAVLGAEYLPYMFLRGVGRIAFPIYCWLLAEGAHYTRSEGRYALRLGLGFLLSEIPFDLALFGGITWQHQNVFLTLLLGFGAMAAMKRIENPILRLVTIVPFCLAADLMRSDYGGYGVAMIGIMYLVREFPHRKWCALAVMALFCAMTPSMGFSLGKLTVSLELLGILAAVPIALYTGRKRTHSKAVQWAFLLFYPIHLILLFWIRRCT